jgi:protein-tyrosine phosphatase
MTGMQDAPIVPFEDAYWVVPGRLLAGPHPSGGSREATARRTLALVDAGIRCIVNLTMSQEERPGDRYEEAAREISDLLGLEVHCVRYALWDGTCPSEGAVRELLDAVDACLAGGLPVYVHCMAGLGRTGVVAGCYVARHGLASGRRALRHLARLRSATSTSRIRSPTTREQRERVRRWKPGA